MGYQESEKAISLHKKSTVVDAAVIRTVFDDPRYFKELQDGGVDVAVLSVHGGSREDFKDTVGLIDLFSRIIERNKDMFFATRAEDLRKAKDGKVAVAFGFQDSRPLEDKLEYLRTFYKLGVRVIAPTYNPQNSFGSGCCDLTDTGLTYLGRELVEEMDRLGIVIDLAHCGDSTTSETIEYSKNPVICSHSNARSICNTLRNKTDEQIKALAAKGGVIGVTIFPSCVRKDQPPRPTLDDLLNHIDYIVKIAGADHVGFGFDLNRKGVDEKWVMPSLARWRTLRPDVYGTVPPEYSSTYPPFPEGIEKHPQFPNITKGLVARGYSDGEIEKMLGGNFLRVFERVWK